MNTDWNGNDAKATKANERINWTQIRILRYIKKHQGVDSRTGISVNELAKKMGINRSTVSRNCEVLEAERMIARDSKKSGYRLTELAMSEPTFHKRVLRIGPSDKLWEMEIPLSQLDEESYKEDLKLIGESAEYEDQLFSLSDPKRKAAIYDIEKKNTKIIQQNKFFCFDLDMYENEMNGENRSYTEDVELFLFANKIGALITKILMLSMTPYSLSLGRSRIRHELLRQIDESEKHSNTLKFLKSMVNPITILEEFCKLHIVKRGLSGPTYEMDEKNFGKLKNIYDRVFEFISKRLDNFEGDSNSHLRARQKLLNQYKTSVRRLERNDPNHTKCKGEIVPVFFSPSGKTRICKKCQRYFKT
jgi:DNA-binding Lrp family transcriptional regulator